MPTPQLLSRKTNGATGAQSSNDAPKAPRVKAPVQGEKVTIRRLPPGMTEEEFVTILGDEWMVGHGKVDWFSYWEGKVSQHPSKPSTPSRAYLHVTRRDDLTALSQKVQSSTWEDAKETYNDPALISAPTVEFAIYKKIPSEKKRVDPRQGTIDQDPEFMAFLEALANPDASREAEADQAEETGKIDKTATTPLVEYLREKKAAKAKEVAALKSAKHARQDSQGAKGKTAPAPPEEPKKRSRDGRAEKEKAEKAPDRTSDRPRESVKILTKKAAAAAEAAEAAKAVAAQIKPSPLSSSQPGGQEPPLSKSRRAGIAAAARILQRDLGLSPGNAHRKARQEAAKGPEVKGTATKETVSPAAPEPAPPPIPAEPSASSAPAKTQPPASGRSRNRKRGAGEDSAKAKGEANGEKAAEPSTPAPPKAPITMLKKKDSQQGQSPQPQSAPSPAPAGPSKAIPPAQPASMAPPSGPKSVSQKQAGGSKKANAPATPSPGATRAFVKHANHSQGVTDALLKEALQAFGTVTSVEIDRKKGFAYVDFDAASGLAKAMAASPVTVAQATVQVLERKEMGKKGPGSGSGQGKNAGASASTPTPAAAPPKVQMPAPAPAPAPVEQSSAPSTPVSTGPAAEKAGGEQQSKRGGRRRGGRGRGDKDSKEAKESPKDGGSKKQDGGGGAATPAAGCGR